VVDLVAGRLDEHRRPVGGGLTHGGFDTIGCAEHTEVMPLA